MNSAVRKYLSQIGRQGGLVSSEAKAKASRENGKLGGRPKKVLSEAVDSFGIPLAEDMASYDKRDTGLPMNVIILSRGGEKHGPRVKFQQDHGQRLNRRNTTSVTISDDPKIPKGQKWELSAQDFKMACQFIRKNKALLLKYWRGELLTRELEAGLTKV